METKKEKPGLLKSFIKIAAMVITPAKLISNGASQIKENLESKVLDYQKTIKINMMLYSVLFMFGLFLSATLTLLINRLTHDLLISLSIMSGVYLLAFLILGYIFKYKDGVEK